MFGVEDAFFEDGIEFTRMPLFYPYFDDEFGYDISLTPLDGYEGDVFIEYAELFEGSVLFDKYQEARRYKEVFCMCAAAGDSNLGVTHYSYPYEKGETGPRLFDGHTLGRVYRVLDQAGMDLITHINSLDMHTGHNLDPTLGTI
jgi:hypothetical protein